MEGNGIQNQLNKLIELYNELDKNDKRNELSSLIGKINTIINELLKLENASNIFDVKNYDTKSQKNMKEEEVLSFIYEDVYSLKNNLLLLLSIMINNKNNSQ